MINDVFCVIFIMGYSMLFKYLGTAAAEGFPALFCNCDACKRALNAGGRNIRGRSAALLDGHILIDFPADMLAYKIRYNLDLINIKYILFTHSHIDHLAANELCYYHHWYSNRDTSGSGITIFGNAKVLQLIQDAYKFDTGSMNDSITLCQIELFKKIELGEIIFTPLAAKHDSKEECAIYLIETNESKLLYANDSGPLPDTTYNFLKGTRLDFVSLDCTCGKISADGGHMGFPENLLTKNRLIEQGSADNTTTFISHHFSHNGLVTYDDFSGLAAGSGFISSWDGMELVL